MSKLKNLAKVDGDDQLAASQISLIDMLLDHAHEEAIPLVEWALTPIGHSSPSDA